MHMHFLHTHACKHMHDNYPQTEFHFHQWAWSKHAHESVRTDTCAIACTDDITGAISSTLKTLNIVYLTAAVYSTAVFSCVTLSDGRRVLAVFPDELCNSSMHNLYMVLGVLGIIFYMLGCPIPLLGHRTRAKIYTTVLFLEWPPQNNVRFPALVFVALVWMRRKRLQTNRDFLEMFGWIYRDYESRVFYYGLLNILRRLVFVLIYNVPSPRYMYCDGGRGGSEWHSGEDFCVIWER